MTSPLPETEGLWVALMDRVKVECHHSTSTIATEIAVKAWNERADLEWEQPYQLGIAYMKQQLGIIPAELDDEYNDVMLAQEIYSDLQEGR